MAKPDVIPVLNDNILNRRRSSITDHVNRIRTANSKRQLVPWWGNLEERKFINFETPKANETESGSQFMKSSSDCIKSIDSPEKLPTNKSKKKKFKKSRPISNELSLDSVKPSSSASDKKLKIHTGTPNEAFRKKDALGNSAKKNKNNVRKSFKLTKPKQTFKTPGVRKKKTGTTKKEQNEKEIDGKYPLEQNSDWEDLINQKKNLTSKDIIVLKWLHTLKCPSSAVRNPQENDSQSTESKNVPIRILKRPLDSPVSQNIKSEVNKTSIKKNSPEEVRSLADINIERKNQGDKRIIRNKMNQSFSYDSVKLPENKEKGNFTHVHPNGEIKDSESKEEKDASVENSREVPDVELRVSELEKLQIIMNLKSLSPEDAAVIIWLDELPESFWKPDFRRRLSITSIKDASSRKRSATVLKSSSVQDIEDSSSPKPNIYFPSVTLLKNLVVDSKVGLRSLDEDSFNSIYYKRCNLIHSESQEVW